VLARSLAKKKKKSKNGQKRKKTLGDNATRKAVTSLEDYIRKWKEQDSSMPSKKEEVSRRLIIRRPRGVHDKKNDYGLPSRKATSKQHRAERKRKGEKWPRMTTLMHISANQKYHAPPYHR